MLELRHARYICTQSRKTNPGNSVFTAGARAGGVAGYLRGVTFCLLWYLSIMAGFYLLYCPLLPLLFLSPHHYRAFTEIIFGAWETYPTVSTP
jgi:hypothetical protein